MLSIPYVVPFGSPTFLCARLIYCMWWKRWCQVFLSPSLVECDKWTYWATQGEVGETLMAYLVCVCVSLSQETITMATLTLLLLLSAAFTLGDFALGGDLMTESIARKRPPHTLHHGCQTHSMECLVSAGGLPFQWRPRQPGEWSSLLISDLNWSREERKPGGALWNEFVLYIIRCVEWLIYKCCLWCKGICRSFSLDYTLKSAAISEYSLSSPFRWFGEICSRPKKPMPQRLVPI